MPVTLDSAEHLNHLVTRILDAAFRIHREVGPGLLESAYQACLVHELRTMGVAFEVQKPLPLVYRCATVDCAYRADIVVEQKVLIEVKALATLAPIHVRQVFTYVRVANYPIGLLLTFGAPTMKEGIRRIVNGFPGEQIPPK